MKYQKVDKKILSRLEEIVGTRYVLTDAEKMEPYAHDETPTHSSHHSPEVVVFPGSTEEIAALVRLANQERIPITPRGAGSGLSGGAIPVFGGMVLSLERMNRILQIDTENMVAVLEPGVIPNELNKELQEFGLFYAGYPMSLETCFIGGNVAENAGGGKAIKYGVTERYVLGLELVTPTGEIVSLGGKRVKDVTGYNIKQLIVGSEGTLGIVTQVILRLLPLPAYSVTLLTLLLHVRQAMAMVPKIMTQSRIIPTSLEIMDHLSFSTSCQYLNEELPYGEAEAMLLIEVDGNSWEQIERDYETIGELCLQEGALEVYVADNHTTRERVWSIRRSIAEAFMVDSPQQSLEDIVVPIAAIPDLMEVLERIASRYALQMPCYGHAGDGNLHITLVKNPESSLEEWYQAEKGALKELYQETVALGGTISGEHGIGTKRREYMEMAVSPEQIDLMKRIKEAFDPNYIMNPGKLI